MKVVIKFLPAMANLPVDDGVSGGIYNDIRLDILNDRAHCFWLGKGHLVSSIRPKKSSYSRECAIQFPTQLPVFSCQKNFHEWYVFVKVREEKGLSFDNFIGFYVLAGITGVNNDF